MRILDILRGGATGDRALDGRAIHLMATTLLFDLCNQLSGAFVIIYLYRLGKSLTYVATYHIALFAVIAIAALPTAALIRRAGASRVMAASTLLYIAFFATILLLRERVVDYVVFFGALRGMASCSWNLSRRIMVNEVVSSANREVYFGRNGALSKIIGMVTPLISGGIIALHTGLSGYVVLFGICLALMIAVGILAMRLDPCTTRGKFAVPRLIGKGAAPSARRLVAAYGFMGVYEGASIFAFSVFAYVATGSELGMGTLGTALSALGIAVSWFAPLLITPRTRRAWFGWGALGVASATAMVGALPISAPLLMAHKVLTSLFGVGYGWGFEGGTMDAVADLSQDGRYAVEGYALTELSLSVVRVAVLLLYVLVDPGGTVAGAQMFVLFSAPAYLGIYFLLRGHLRTA